MKGALIGFGTIAQGHLTAYSTMDDLSIVAIVDESHKRLKLAESLMPHIKTYNNLDDLISDFKLDFIDICSPPNTHFGYISLGLLNNYHVICEKPLLLSSHQYRDIFSLQHSADKVIYPSHNYKFSPILQLAKEIVLSEQFGTIITGHFRTLRSGHAIGVSEWNPHWRRDLYYSGGGILRDHGTHSIYIACEMCGRIPNAVSCIIGNLSDDGYHTTEDTVLLTLYFEDQIQFSITLSWASAIRSSYYSIIGNNENIIIEDDNMIHSKRDGEIIRRSLISEFNDPSHKSWFNDMLHDFTNAVTAPNRRASLLQEALVTSLVVEAAYHSAGQGGKRIALPKVMDFIPV